MKSRNRVGRAGVVLASALVSVAVTSPTAAQDAPKVLYACYVPSAGVTYRIKEPGLRQECLGNHVEFSWNPSGATGPQGDVGPQGPPGPQGPAGGLTGYVTPLGSIVTVEAGTTVNASVACPAGKVAVGGGYNLSSNLMHVLASHSFNILDTGESFWVVTVDNTNSSNGSLRVSAVCATAP